MIKTAMVEDFTTELNPLMLTEQRDRMLERFTDPEVVPAMFQPARVTEPGVADWVASLVSLAAATRLTRVESGGSLLLVGPTGTGKTWQAYGALRALSESGAYCSWRFITAPDLFAQLRPRPNVDPEQVYESYASAHLLVLDELGAQRDSEWTGEYLGRLIDIRWKHQRATLITSNVLPEQFAHRFGDRITSRLAQMCTQVALTGPDRRRDS